MPVKPEDLKRGKQDPAKAVQFNFDDVDISTMSLMSLLQLGGGLLLKHAIAGEISEHLGRSYYQHGEAFKGYRNGYQETRLDTPNGPIVYDRRKLAIFDRVAKGAHRDSGSTLKKWSVFRSNADSGPRG